LPETLAALESYPWPGNAREFGEHVARALILAATDPIARAHLPAAVRGDAPVATMTALDDLLVPGFNLSSHQSPQLAEDVVGVV
jgi:two-component system response regulator PilR (NtrC family)